MKIKFVVFFILFSFTSFSQTILKGNLVNQSRSPVPNVGVFLKSTGSQIIVAYAYSEEDGSYFLEVNQSGSYELSFSALAYKTQIVSVKIDEVGNDILNDVILYEEALSLNEVIVSADVPIKVKKDTIVFSAERFSNGTEETVEDLLKKIPGLSVDDNGSIKIGNQEIEKLMIDGDDFFEKGYKVLSKNMPAQPIDKIELLQNYSNNRLLKNIETSDKVALNLKLKGNAKRLWFGNLIASYGVFSANRYDFQGNLMNFGKKNKYYFLTNLNNVGYDATGDIQQLIRPYRIDEPSSIGDNDQISPLLSLSLNTPINFRKERTNFNNAELVSLNAIFNIAEKIKIKTLAFFNWDETRSDRNSVDFVNVNGASFTNTENFRFSGINKVAFGKLDLTYNISKTKMLEAVTKFSNAAAKNTSNLLFNGNATIEKLQSDNYLFDQKASFSNKFSKKQVYLITGRFIKEKTPQNYRINQFYYEELFPEFNNANNVNQFEGNQMQFVGVNGHLLAKNENDNLFEMQLGNEYRRDILESKLTLFEDESGFTPPNGYQNNTVYAVNDIYFKAKYKYLIKDFSLIADLHLHQLFNRIENRGISNSQSPFFVNPKIGLDWKINDKNKISSSYSYNITNASIIDVYSDFVLTGFRSFESGTGDFNQLDAKSLILNYESGNWNDRFFANTFVVYSKNQDFLANNSLVQQNYAQSNKVLINDRAFLSLNSKFDYYFKAISSNLKLDLSYSKSDYKNIVNGLNRKVNSKNYNWGLELRSGFKGIFNYHLGAKWKINKIETNFDRSFFSNISFLDMDFVFNEDFNIQLKTECYFFENQGSENTYYFMDMDARYKFKRNKLTFGLSAKNIFNTERFRNFTISDLGTSIDEYRLLPRFALLKIEYRF